MAFESYRSQTQNFLWDKCQLLGQGRVGYVFKGIRKQNGEPVAVKSLTLDGHRRTVELQLREFEILKKINHENIVRVLAIEEELFPANQVPNGKTVIVMELCTGGSLHSILQEPENLFGLAEDEFLVLYLHLTRVVSYLRENKISHRDLKPSNILKFIREDGEIIYKVTDFDTARDLEEEETFQSIVGTPMYAHPDMFSRYLKRSDKLCSSSIDLWSIGATLYEAATGRLPFRPYDWRDLYTMDKKILSEKPSGMISGEQRVANGPIIWSDTLPKECSLSDGLKQLLVPVFAALFERESETCWTFQKYFDVSNNILERKRVHIFYLNQLNFLRVYLDTDKQSHYKDLLESINSQVHIPTENQIILFKGTTLSSILGNESTCAIPNTTEDNPLILCDKDETNISKSWKPSTRLFKPFPNVHDLKSDAELAKRNMMLCYIRKRESEKVCRTIQLFNSAVLTINQVVVSQLMGVSKENHQVHSLVQSLENQLDMMNGFYKTCESFLPFIPTQLENVEEDLEVTIEFMAETFRKARNYFESLKDDLTKVTPSLVQLLDGRAGNGNRSLIIDWEKLSRKIPELSNANGILGTGLKLINKLERSYELLRMDTPNRPNEDEKVIKERDYYRRMERLRMSDTCNSLEKWSCRFFEIFDKSIESFSEWYHTAQAAVLQPEILMQDIVRLRIKLNQFETELNTVVNRFQEKLQIFTSGLTNITTYHQLQKAAKDSNPSRCNKVNAKSLEEIKEKIFDQVQFQQELRRACEETSYLQQELNQVTTQLAAYVSKPGI